MLTINIRTIVNELTTDKILKFDRNKIEFLSRKRKTKLDDELRNYERVNSTAKNNRDHEG